MILFFSIIFSLLSAGVVGICLLLFFRRKRSSREIVVSPKPEEPTVVEPTVVGPKKGTLVIMGGAGDTLTDFQYIFGKFVELAGGAEARIVVVTTVSKSTDKALEEAERLGVAEVTLMHTYYPEVADTAEFVKPITTATGIWFGGGRQWRYVHSYEGTQAEKEFSKVLERGGVIGGTSAGASIQGSFLVRGDTSLRFVTTTGEKAGGSTILIGNEQRGFGYMENTAIDQHVVVRGREEGLIEVLEDPENKMWEEFDRGALLGIGIDENVAIVVQGDRFEVIGKENGAVLVYDPKKWNASTPNNEKWVTLRTGDSYDLKRREVL